MASASRARKPAEETLISCTNDQNNHAAAGAFTRQQQGDAARADPPVLGAVGEGAQAEHHAGEAAQHRQQHEGPRGVPEGWTGQRRGAQTRQRRHTHASALLLAAHAHRCPLHTG